jgi:flagellar M-ring protein FliF
MASLPQIFGQLRAALLQMSIGKRITLMSLILGTLIGFVFLMLWSGRVDYQRLYANLDPEDAGAIVEKLKEQKIHYQLDDNGRTLLVPREQLYEIRMQLASEGLPQAGGIGFEVFDETKLGMSEFAQNVNFQRALQGELARSIKRIQAVESARIHIVMPEKSLFLTEEEPASASVVLKLKAGKWLSRDQIDGIVHLVSSSVSRLSPEHVTVVDNTGKLLAGSTRSSASGTASLEQLEYQARVEKDLEHRVRTMLESALGEEKAIVRLSCAFDFQRQETTEERYLPENRVVRSEQMLSESSSKAGTVPQGVPGIKSNLPGARPQANTIVAPSNPAFSKEDRTVNYEIGKVINHIQEPVGELTRVSVAVMVDGTYNRTVSDAGEIEWQYTPRSEEEMKQLENLVKRAVNYDRQRGDDVEVVNIPFETNRALLAERMAEVPAWRSLLDSYKPYFKHVFIGLFLLLTFLFFVKPMVRWVTELSRDDTGLLQQLPKTVGELESEMGRDVKRLPSVDQVSELVTSDNETSIGVVRNWMNES